MSSKKEAVDAGQTAPDLEIVGNQVTLHPSGVTGGYESQSQDQEHEDDGIPERNLVRHMARFRENPFDFLREVSLFVSGTGWRAYDSVIGQPIYCPGYSDNIKRLVIESPLLQSKVAQLAEARLQVEQSEGLYGQSPDAVKNARARRKKEIVQSLRDVVDTMMDNMICKMDSKAFIRSAYYIATQLLTRAYHQGRWPIFIPFSALIYSNLTAYLVSQAFTCPVRKFSAYDLWHKLLQRKNNRLYFCRAINPTSTMSPCR